MKKLFRLLLKPIVVLAICALANVSNAADKIPVLASFSILGDLVRVVGANRVTVSVLVGPDEDAHVFEPKPSDAKNILQAQLLVTNGLGFEHWAQKLIKSSGYKGLVVVASQGVMAQNMPTEKGDSVETDPHAWQDPTNVAIYVRNIAAALSKLDPAGARIYQLNSEVYTNELKALDADAKIQISLIPVAKRKVITSHDAFGYFGAHYGIKFLAPQGISTNIEPSAKQIAQLIQQIQIEKIKAIFFENMSSSKLLSQLSKDVGVTVGPELYVDALSKADGPATSYLKLMRYNVTQLVAGMKKN
uniref:Zn-binding component of ABC-type Zn uptake system, ZnuA n=2 Tax=unclassified Polaromonas TaxID=2638319 RepID=A0A2S1FHN4_9BURK|nr:MULTISPECIES: zinc ABC transporter substrate-binding protein [unclassified Polaromonas]AWD71965.1 Zn-binding component of ABC-type Zn uptake system, ZnuA [Polaromonas sp. E10S]AWD72030.1 ABC-type Zn uptake system ZnuABC, Zn-binding component ZnuA [Polaromonas sp. E19S]